MASPSLTEMALIDLETQGENMSTEGRALHNGIWNGQGYARMPPYFKIDTRFVYLIENWKATPVDVLIRGRQPPQPYDSPGFGSPPRFATYGR